MVDREPSFTRDKWLDGVIWGSGAKSTRRSVSINVSDLPLSIVDLMKKRLVGQGYETQEREVPNAITRQVDFILYAIGTEPAFDKLPSYSARRLLATFNDEFINGFLLTKLIAKRKARVNEDQFSFKDVDVVIYGGIDSNEIIKILQRRRVDFSKSYRSICVKPNSYIMEPFSTFVSGLEEELNEFMEDIKDEDAILSDIQEGIVEKMTKDSSRRIRFRSQEPDIASMIGIEQEGDPFENLNNDSAEPQNQGELSPQTPQEDLTSCQGVETMQFRLRSYSYRFSEEIMNSRMHLKKQLEKSILDILTDPSTLTRPRLNELIDTALQQNGWASQTRLLDDGNEDMMKIDYLKDRVQVEVETGHPSFLGIDLLKFQLASPSCHDRADVGIYIVTTDNFQKTMIDKFRLPWEGSITFEKVVRSLPSFKAAIQVPIYVIGLDV